MEKFCFLVFAWFFVRASDGFVSNETLLFNDLFLTRGHISTDVRPIYNKSKSISVLLSIALVYIFELNDREQSLKTNIWMRQYWTNEFLTWTPNQYGGVKEIIVDARLVWKPDIVLYNSVNSQTGQIDQYKSRIVIRYDGQHAWYVPAILKSTCTIDIRYFPFDFQKCTLKFGSWGYLSNELDLKITRQDIDLSSLSESLQFKVANTSARRHETKYSCCPYPYVDVTFSIVLKRQSGTFVLTVMLPTLVLTFFGVIIFAYPPSIGQRIGLAMNSFFTIAVITQMSSNTLPIDSNESSLFATFMLTCFITMAISIAMNTASLNLNRVIPVPLWLHDVVFERKIQRFIWDDLRKGKFNPWVLCESLFHARKAKECEEVDESDSFRMKVLNSGMLNAKVEHSSDCSTFSEDLSEEDENVPYASRLYAGMSKENIQMLKENARDIENLRGVVNTVLNRKQREMIADFWSCISNTMDRLFLLIFFTSYIMIVFILFLKIPTDH